MAVATTLFTEDPTQQLDDLLLTICEELQLTPARYDLAVERYTAVCRYLDSTGSPFAVFRPKLYPQGSMLLNTTVKPIIGPHDLDFVLELSREYTDVNPMALIKALHDFLRASRTYGSMVSLKNRCVRIEYADEFYMDILPACKNSDLAGTCIKVPDREIKGWSDSNPIGYGTWFIKERANLYRAKLLEKFAAMPVPAQQQVADKKPLQLLVQLVKRWRDLRFANVDGAPISVVLTTLAAKHYDGEQSVSVALGKVLREIVSSRVAAEQRGGRLVVVNPTNLQEDLSERWDKPEGRYDLFREGIDELNAAWEKVLNRSCDVPKMLQNLFGEPVKAAFAKQASRLQEVRKRGALGVATSGLIGLTKPQMPPIPMNTFYGEEEER